MTVKEIAEHLGCSTQNVRVLIKNHKKELKGHISSKPQLQLDDEGVEIIGQYRVRSQVQIYDNSKDRQLENLKKELEEKTQMLISAQQELLNLQRATTELQLEHGKTQLLLESSEREADRLQKRTDELQAELDSYERTIFGFYRKKKSR